MISLPSQRQRGGRMKKQAFQLYGDYKDMVDALSDEQAGQLIKALFAHEAGEDMALEGALRGIYILVANSWTATAPNMRRRARATVITAARAEGRPKAAQPQPNRTKPAKTRANRPQPLHNPKKPIRRRIRRRIRRQKRRQKRRQRRIRKVSLFAALRPAHTPLLPRPALKSPPRTR